MKSDVHIRKRWLIHHLYWISLVLFFILTQSALALSTSDQQANWQMCTFESEHFGHNLCIPGLRRNTFPYSCTPKKRCCSCPEGTFMDKYNNCTVCKTFRDCKAEGRQVQVNGSTIQDTVCEDEFPTSSEAPMTTPFPPAVKGTSTIQPDHTNPQLDDETSGPPLGTDEEADGAGEGTSVIKFDAVHVGLGTILVICFFVIVLLISKPAIPQRLNAVLARKKTEVKSCMIHMSECEEGEGVISQV